MNDVWSHTFYQREALWTFHIYMFNLILQSADNRILNFTGNCLYVLDKEYLRDFYGKIKYYVYDNKIETFSHQIVYMINGDNITSFFGQIIYRLCRDHIEDFYGKILYKFDSGISRKMLIALIAVI